MSDFDWSWSKCVDRAAVEAVLPLDFLDQNPNVVLMIAQNIAYSAIQAGHSALFATASQILLDLSGQESARASTGGSSTPRRR